MAKKANGAMITTTVRLANGLTGGGSRARTSSACSEKQLNHVILSKAKDLLRPKIHMNARQILRFAQDSAKKKYL